MTYQLNQQLTGPLGNNALSYDQRMALGSQGFLDIASLIQGELDDVQLGNRIAFEEVVEDKLMSYHGLKHFVELDLEGKSVWIFDNHNHALYFWRMYQQRFWKTPVVLHIDQHSDLGTPASRPDTTQKNNESYIRRYANEVTQVGNFILPAQRLEIVGEVVQIRTQYAVDQRLIEPLPEEYILDIDMDFWVSELAHIDHTMELVERLISYASAVTIATSPYFIDQQQAIDLLKVIIHNHRQNNR